MAMRIVSPGTRQARAPRPQAPRAALPAAAGTVRTVPTAQRPGAPGTRVAPARPANVGAAQPRMVPAQNVPPHIRARSAALAASRAPQAPSARRPVGPVVRRVIEQEPAVDVAAEAAPAAAPDDAGAWSDPASREALLLDLAGRLRMASIELGELSRRGELEEPKSLAEQLRSVAGVLAGIREQLEAVTEIPAELDTGDRWQLTVNALADLSDALELVATRVHAVEQLRVARLPELVAGGNLEGANAVLEGYTETIRAADEPPEIEPPADEAEAAAEG